MCGWVGGIFIHINALQFVYIRKTNYLHIIFRISCIHLCNQSSFIDIELEERVYNSIMDLWQLGCVLRQVVLHALLYVWDCPKARLTWVRFYLKWIETPGVRKSKIAERLLKFFWLGTFAWYGYYLFFINVINTTVVGQFHLTLYSCMNDAKPYTNIISNVQMKCS